MKKSDVGWSDGLDVRDLVADLTRFLLGLGTELSG